MSVAPAPLKLASWRTPGILIAVGCAIALLSFGNSSHLSAASAAQSENATLATSKPELIERSFAFDILRTPRREEPQSIGRQTPPIVRPHQSHE